ncbi:MAG: SRPBCC domain-containing protein [Bdellovibrionales bacterium]|nr:SRPBCC domain-containing protein [Bdellovibrionales bacterium]
MCKTIKQKVHFKASPQVIYDLLVDSRKHTQLTGKKAEISKKVGGAFRSGSVTGVNVDLVPGKRIVQAWRDRDFPEGVFSMAAVTLVDSKSGGTDLTLTHRGVPKDLIPRVDMNWRQNYWQKIKERIAKA